MTKKCKICKKVKNLIEENFKKSLKTEDGFNLTCISCGEKALKSSRLNRSAINKRQRDKQKENKENNCCIICGKESLVDFRFCELHFYKDNSFRHLGSKKHYKILEDKFISQNKKCIYTGLDLTLGKNASVDHIKSIALFPELKNDFNNVQWVDIKVNLMKRELKETDFLQLIKLIYENKKL